MFILIRSCSHLMSTMSLNLLESNLLPHNPKHIAYAVQKGLDDLQKKNLTKVQVYLPYFYIFLSIYFRIHPYTTVCTFVQFSSNAFIYFTIIHMILFISLFMIRLFYGVFNNPYPISCYGVFNLFGKEMWDTLLYVQLIRDNGAGEAYDTMVDKFKLFKQETDRFMASISNINAQNINAYRSGFAVHVISCCSFGNYVFQFILFIN